MCRTKTPGNRKNTCRAFQDRHRVPGLTHVTRARKRSLKMAAGFRGFTFDRIEVIATMKERTESEQVKMYNTKFFSLHNMLFDVFLDYRRCDPITSLLKTRSGRWLHVHSRSQRLNQPCFSWPAHAMVVQFLMTV